MSRRFPPRPVVRLPLGVAPIDDEHAGSFVHRLAITNGLTASQLSAMWGTVAEGVRVARSGHQATPQLVSRLDLLTGGVVADLESLWVYPPARFLVAAPRWRPMLASRYCPHCLADIGAWLHAWRSRLNVMCVRHGCLLRDRCPNCDAITLGHGRLDFPGPQAPVICAACETSLICLEPVPGSMDWPSLVEVQGRGRQRWLAADRDRVESDLWTLRGAALRVGPELPFEAPEVVAVAWEGWRALSDTQRSPTALAPAVAAAALMLADVALRDAHALRRLYGDRPASLWQVRAAARSQQMAATAASALDRRPLARRSRMLAETPCAFDAVHVPQRLPAELYQRFFADIDPRAPRVTRRVVPIVLAAMASRCDWQQAATGLGVAPLAGASTVSDWLDAARATDSLDVALERLRAIAAHYGDMVAVDYAARRRRCRRLEMIDATWWRDACERVGQRAGRNGVKNRCAAVFVWQHATSGDPWRAVWLAGVDAPRRRNAYRQFATTNLPALRSDLEILGGQLADLSV
jgi:hypothetical protein